MPANEAQRKVWNAPDQAQVWAKREVLTTAVTPHLLARVAPKAGERLLEIGSGGGLVAMQAAKAVGPSGSVTGFDLSGPLVGLATERAAAAGATNVRFVAGDAQTDDIPGGPFDAVMSQFGVMFFADPVAAFSNIRRHLRPDARLAFACWRGVKENRWFPAGIIAKYLPAPPPAATNDGPPPGPFAFADAAYVAKVLTGAGFTDVGCEPIEVDVAVPDETIHEREMLRERGVPPDQQDAAWAELTAVADSMRGSDGLLHFTLAPQLITANAS
jgi:SAM-dependent methyltransferase